MRSLHLASHIVISLSFPCHLSRSSSLCNVERLRVGLDVILLAEHDFGYYDSYMAHPFTRISIPRKKSRK